MDCQFRALLFSEHHCIKKKQALRLAKQQKEDENSARTTGLLHPFVQGECSKKR